MTIQVNSDTILVKLRGTVTGVTRKSVEIRDEREGESRETEKNLTVTKANEAECEKGQTLLNQIRAAVDKYTVNVENLSLSNRAKVEAMMRELEDTFAAIEYHNRYAQHHKVDYTLLRLPISIETDPAAVRAVLSQIVAELDAAKDHCLAGDVPALTNWLKRSKNLAALVPAVTAAVIDDAIEEVRSIKSQLAKDIKEMLKDGTHELDAAKGVAGARVQIIAIDTAIGMVAPQSEAAIKLAAQISDLQ